MLSESFSSSNNDSVTNQKAALKTSVSVIAGQTDYWIQQKVQAPIYLQKEDATQNVSKVVAVESTSDESDSSDEGASIYGSCSKLLKIVDVSVENAKLLELDSRVGLNGSQCHWSFPCLLDQITHNFYVMLGNVTIDRFTKSTFLNLVAQAEKAGAKQMILIQKRENNQKDQFRKLFQVLDAQRLGKAEMTQLLTKERLGEWIIKYAVYAIEL